MRESKGDRPIIDDDFDHIRHIEQWLTVFGIKNEDIGIIIGPETVQSQDAIKITYSVRVLNDNYSGRYEIDGSYTFPDVEAETVIEDIYPQMIESFENHFGEANIQYYDSDLPI